ncbi:MAG TPA: hypothetical protein VJV79_40440, partial [Polyangiaceae bacterium]|nr:hypothetical protein [Polyangiaceae bacterium]
SMARETKDIMRYLGDELAGLVDRLDRDKDFRQAIENGLDAIDQGSLSWARLNQVMHLASEAGMSEGLYRYYFLEVPKTHPYPVEKVRQSTPYKPPEGLDSVQSLGQLQWGIRRFMYDALLFWGNFRQAYRDLRQKSFEEIQELFARKSVDEGRLARRGKVVEPTEIPRDNRYLISEMACKTYDKQPKLEDCEHIEIALKAFRELREKNETVTPESLRNRAKAIAEGSGQLLLFELLFEDASGQLNSESDVVALYRGQSEAFEQARSAALENTRVYLSICNDLDVYVATSMRTRDDFREMARACETIFRDPRLARYNIRYFDPTLSAANYHEDKGIIECLMVKTAKILLYFAQHKESLGKISEYAMAVSLGKPVIILCPEDAKGREVFQFYRDKHPLIRLIEFHTGIVNGAIVTNKTSDVPLLIQRILSNGMEYDLQLKPRTTGYFLLKERVTQSTVRVVTDDKLLTETFWNNYHQIH